MQKGQRVSFNEDLLSDISMSDDEGGRVGLSSTILNRSQTASRNAGIQEFNSLQGEIHNNLITPKIVAEISDKLQESVSKMFSFVDEFEPQEQYLNPILKPFIPSFIPCVGDIDAFIKIPRPDGKSDQLGLVVLDEPSAVQSNPSDLKLRSLSKIESTVPQIVRSIDHDLLNKDKRALDEWIESMAKLNTQKYKIKGKPGSSGINAEALMQAWPIEMEEAFNDHDIAPGPDIALDLVEYTKLVALILDVRTTSVNHKSCNNSIIESVYQIFGLYNEFNKSDHFKRILMNKCV